MKKNEMLICIVLLMLVSNIFGQDQVKEVTLTTSGSGNTQEYATQAALRSAIEQAFGAFISARTEILNDEIVSDQITSVSSGNIKSYEVLNALQLPDGSWGVTIKTIVSIDKLESFVQAKGVSIELQGGMFALNVKQQILNEQGEINVVAELIGMLHEIMQISFDYNINSSNPKSIDSESKYWEIPLTVTATCNENIDFCGDYFIKTIQAVSLTANEVETYKSLNKQVFKILAIYKSKSYVFYLRKKSSIDAINSLKYNFEYYARNFSIQSGAVEIFWNSEWEIQPFDKNTAEYTENNVPSASISFLSAGQIVCKFNMKDKRTLNEIEKMTGYNIKSRGLISSLNYGGYIVREPGFRGYVGLQLDYNGLVLQVAHGSPASKAGISSGDKIIRINDEKYHGIFQLKNAITNGKNIFVTLKDFNGRLRSINIAPEVTNQYDDGLIVSLCHIGILNWKDAINECEDLVLFGYSDWHLPNKDDLELIYQFFHATGLVGFKAINGFFWSKTEHDESSAVKFSLRSEGASEAFKVNSDKYSESYVVPVRYFK